MSFDLTNKNISETFQNVLQRTGSDNHLYDLEGNKIGDLRISGSLIAQEYVVSSSVTNITTQQLSGSTVFGNSADDTHQFTGSISASANLNVDGIIKQDNIPVVLSTQTGSLVTNIDSPSQGNMRKTDAASGISSNITLGLRTTDNVKFNHITASGDISASGALSIGSTIYAKNIGTGTDDSVVILDSDGTFKTDEINSLVWGSTIIHTQDEDDGYIPYFDDGVQMGKTNLYWSTNKLGIGTSGDAPKTLTVQGDISSSGAIHTLSHITASGNISSSTGNLYLGGNIYFDNASAIYFPPLSGDTDTGIIGLAGDLIVAADDDVLIQAGGSGTDTTFFGEGRVRINSTITSAPTSTLEVNGNISSSGNFISANKKLPTAASVSSSFVRHAAVTGSFAQRAAVSGSFVRHAAVTGSFAQKAAVSGSFVRHAAVTGSFVRRSDLSGSINLVSGSSTSTGSFGEIKGAPIWVDYPFNLGLITYDRYYFRDIDDVEDYRKWDDYITDPTALNYRKVAGQYVIPEDCTLVGMSGVVSNNGISTVDPTITILYGTVTEGTGDTTLASASIGKAVSIGTARVPYTFSEEFNVDLSAGQIVIPTVKHSFSGATQSYLGNITLRYKTR